MFPATGIMNANHSATDGMVERAIRKAAHKHRHLKKKGRNSESRNTGTLTVTTSPMQPVSHELLPMPETRQAAEPMATHAELPQELGQEVLTGLRASTWVANGDTSRTWHELCVDELPDEESTHLGTALTGAWRMTDQARSELRAAVANSTWGNTKATQARSPR